MSKTPLMQQYDDIKKQYPDALVLFQVGDFYELFFDDAKVAANFLGITLTQRGMYAGQPIPLAGVPVHTVDHYVLKLVRGGFRVVLVDQLTEAVPGRMVERGVSRVLTPGTLTDVGMLNDKRASFLAAIYPSEKVAAVAFAEFLTGQVFATTVSLDDEAVLLSELGRFMPDEIILPTHAKSQAVQQILAKNGYSATIEAWSDAQIMHGYDPEFDAWVGRGNGSSAFAALGVLRDCVSLLFFVLKKHQRSVWGEINTFHAYVPEDYLFLDAATQKNLELVTSGCDGTGEKTVFSVLDQAATAMGSRVIKKWLLRPLVSLPAIEARQNAIRILVRDVVVRDESVSLLKQVCDFERLVGRIALGRARAGDYAFLKRVLQLIPRFAPLCARAEGYDYFDAVRDSLGDFTSLCEMLDAALYEVGESGVAAAKEWLIKPGYSAELDRLRALTEKGDVLVLELERKEQELTGIGSLKIRYNKVHGYAIEVTNTHQHLVPPRYTRLQTLANRERYTVQELKDIEYDRNRAAVDSVQIERELYQKLVEQVRGYVPMLRKLATALAHLDALLGLAVAAYQNNYVCPHLGDGRDVVIERGRHPVVASLLGHEFVANDTNLTDRESLWIITGPNMGGKSTYMRQVALIAILAQMGSWVPAQRAQLPLFDRVFTRIGASDQVAAGKSTFLVEMEEVSLICAYATERSLVVLDEVGRGTSTYDGFALAYAIAEHIHTTVKARCLFATHYHELAHLAELYPTIAMYHAASVHSEQGMLLLHKIVPGVAEGSFGLEVAKIARVPSQVIARARDVLASMDGAHMAVSTKFAAACAVKEAGTSMSSGTESERELAGYKKALSRLRSVDCNALSPKQAFDLVWELHGELERE